MTDWYPSQDAKLLAFLGNFAENIDAATDTLKLPKGTFDVAHEAATAWLGAYAARQAAQKPSTPPWPPCSSRRRLPKKVCAPPPSKSKAP